jgi:hypothetical protein
MLAVGVFALVFRLLSGPTGAADSDRLIAILVVPFVAAASRLLSWRMQRNFAEHLIALGIPLVGGYITAYTVAGLGLVLAYFLWAYGQAFFDRLWIGAVAGLISLLAGTAAWVASVVALIAVLRS